MKNYEGKHKLQADTLDNLYEQKIIDNIGYIHLDVEGMEHRILLGSVNIISIFNPIITFEGHVRFEKREIQKNVSFLKDRQYSIYMIKDVILRNQCWSDCRNFLAFPSNVDHKEIVNVLNSKYNNCLTPV